MFLNTIIENEIKSYIFLFKKSCTYQNQVLYLRCERKSQGDFSVLPILILWIRCRGNKNLLPEEKPLFSKYICFYRL